jgi:hypothetical protein
MFVLVMHLSADNLEFSRQNTGWNGTSSFFADLDRHRTTDIADPRELAGYSPNTTLLIIAPRNHPTTQQLTAYRAFLDAGNTLILADDFGTGNEILSGIGSQVTILPGNLSSLDRRYADPYSVVAYKSPGESPLFLPESIALNRPAALDGGTPLMLTSVMSWIDANGDTRLNRGEGMGTFPVMAAENRGRGHILVISDPSIFINSMYNQGDNENNRVLIRSLVQKDGQVLIDGMNSRTAKTSGFSVILQAIRTNGTIEIVILCLLMLTLAWAWKTKRL